MAVQANARWLAAGVALAAKVLAASFVGYIVFEGHHAAAQMISGNDQITDYETYSAVRSVAAVAAGSVPLAVILRRWPWASGLVAIAGISAYSILLFVVFLAYSRRVGDFWPDNSGIYCFIDFASVAYLGWIVIKAGNSAGQPNGTTP